MTTSRPDQPAAAPAAAATPDVLDPDAHLCDNYSHLLRAVADLVGRRTEAHASRHVVYFIDDRFQLDEDVRCELERLSGADVVRISDAAAVEAFARLPRRLPGVVRRNISWRSGRPITPFQWAPAELADRSFGTAYVYHPGFFLSKVLAGRSGRVVMRDSGYSNYVRHRVPLTKAAVRLLAGRSPFRQTWGEERWIDEIEVVRPDRLPGRVQRKGRRLTLDDLMTKLPAAEAQAVAMAFWGDHPLPSGTLEHAALLVTQPIELLGICSEADKTRLYADIATRLRDRGFEVVVKPHPREPDTVIPGVPHLPSAFPIEAWQWLDRPPFAAAVSLNSAALADNRVGFALDHLQLVPPTKFYGSEWSTWPSLIDAAFAAWSGGTADRAPARRQAVEAPASTSRPLGRP